jgi:hypothetical protein
MNLEKLAAFRGEAWARREISRASDDNKEGATRPWPGKIAEARTLAGTLGRPRLVEMLARIIQERASAAWAVVFNPERVAKKDS